MTRYFAYGANLNRADFLRRCPGAAYVSAAVLPDHEFRIAVTGYGEAASAPGKDLPGMLWDLSRQDEEALDRFEGVPEGLYRKSFVIVNGADGSRHRAMLYQPTDSAPGTPVPGYLEGIIASAEELGFPAPYIESLRRLLTRAPGSPG